MGAALDRMLALLDDEGLEMPGDEVAAAMHAEAERIIGETTDDHGPWWATFSRRCRAERVIPCACSWPGARGR